MARGACLGETVSCPRGRCARDGRPRPAGARPHRAAGGQVHRARSGERAAVADHGSDRRRGRCPADPPAGLGGRGVSGDGGARRRRIAAGDPFVGRTRALGLRVRRIPATDQVVGIPRHPRPRREEPTGLGGTGRRRGGRGYGSPGGADRGAGPGRRAHRRGGVRRTRCDRPLARVQQQRPRRSRGRIGRGPPADRRPLGAHPAGRTQPVHGTAQPRRPRTAASAVSSRS